ncbi:hypothetical protein QM565_19595 [Geitlerinema splendidum]|nr:hypothetical protein [Geitlerinema splendidum]
MNDTTVQTEGHFVALPSPIAQKDSREEFIHAMHKAGVYCRENIIEDGVIHRFSTGKNGDKNGWYVFYGLAGAFGDWKEGIHEKWKLSNYRNSGMDKKSFSEQIKKDAKGRRRRKV